MKKLPINPEIKKLSIRIKNTANKLETMMQQFEKLTAKEKAKKAKVAKPKATKTKVTKKAKK